MVVPQTAVIYSNGSLECERAAQLLKALDGEYLEYRLDQHFDQRAATYTLRLCATGSNFDNGL